MSSKAIIILGPTATGKSLLALELALKLKTSVINADSIQVYRDLIVGSAQPSKEDLKIVPHNLYGYLGAGATLTVADYCKDVQTLLTTKLSQSPPLFCGGSGFYIQALEKGMFDVPTLTEAQKRTVDLQLTDWGWSKAHSELLQRDPKVAARIHENDHYRIRRAFEILLVTSQKPSEILAQAKSAPLKNKSVIKVGLDLDKSRLHRRIVERTRKMLSEGWIEEVEAILKSGHRKWSALKSVGYAEVVSHIDGHLTPSEMVDKIVISNMQLIKKQKTWFKRDPHIHWYSADDTPRAVEFVLSQNFE